MSLYLPVLETMPAAIEENLLSNSYEFVQNEFTMQVITSHICIIGPIISNVHVQDQIIEEVLFSLYFRSCFFSKAYSKSPNINLLLAFALLKKTYF